MVLKPLEDRVLVEPLETQEQKKGGIIIPDTAKERPEEGKVISVGGGKVLENGQLKKLYVKKGDKVLFSKYAGSEIMIGTVKHMIMREDDILAIIE